MRLHIAGNYNGVLETLPSQRMVKNAVKFREPTPQKLSLVGNALSLGIAVLTFYTVYLRSRTAGFISIPGIGLALLSLLPHEFLHAICFREDVYFYFFLKGGMAFVVGSEDFEKWRFVFMSMLPNVVFGFIPYVVFMVNPSYRFLGTMGALAIAMGAGDYMNVFNALTQVPKNGKIFMYQMSTYWYEDTNAI